MAQAASRPRRSLLGGLLAYQRQAPAGTSDGLQGIWLPAKRGGVVVTHESALQLSACFACIRVISADIAKLPWHVFAEQGGSKIKLARSRIGYLLNTRPNPDTGAFAFRETLLAWALAYGAGYAYIERDPMRQPLALWQTSPDRVSKKRDENGRLYFEISNGTKVPGIVDQADMFEVHGLGFDGLTGYSTIALAAQSIGFGLAAEQHGSAFYGNNAVLGMVLQHPSRLSDEAYKRLKESLDERKGGGAFKPFITEEGMTVQVPATKQVDAQYIETRKAQVEEICRWFRVPLQKVMNQDNAHYSSVEQMNISYVTDTLGEWIKRLEEEADYKLITARAQASYTKINTRAIMRGDSVAQAQWYREMRNVGAYSVDEIREFEDMDPVPGGDKRVMQANMTTLDRIGEESVKPAPPPADGREVANALLRSTVDKLMRWDIEAWGKVRGSVADFDAWLAHHEKGHAVRVARELASISDALMLGFRADVDAESLALRYAHARRVMLETLHSGEAVDMTDEIVATLRDAL